MAMEKMRIQYDCVLYLFAILYFEFICKTVYIPQILKIIIMLFQNSLLFSVDERKKRQTFTLPLPHKHTRTQTHTYTPTHMLARTLARTHTHADAHEHTHAHTHTHSRTHAHVRTHARTHTHTHTHTAMTYLLLMSFNTQTLATDETADVQCSDWNQHMIQHNNK